MQATIDIVASHSPVHIHTHAPHARCDERITTQRRKMVRFLLTHLMRGATYHKLKED